MKNYNDVSYDQHPHHEGWVSSSFGVGFPISNRPSLKMKHIDGPLLTFRDGQMHWLTLWERLMVRLGIHNAETLEWKLRPNLMKAVLR